MVVKVTRANISEEEREKRIKEISKIYGNLIKDIKNYSNEKVCQTQTII